MRDLQQRKQVTAPPVVFGQLLTESIDERQAAQIRTWATELPTIEEGANAWLAGGDLRAMLRDRGISITFFDAYVVAIALREGASLWTFNPRLHDATRIVPVELFEPAGFDRASRTPVS